MLSILALGHNNSFKPTPHRGVNSALYATLHAVATPLRGGLTQALGITHTRLLAMDISTLSLIVAALAVFFGPLISWQLAKHQIKAANDLSKSQIASALLTSNKQIIAPMRQAWINDLRELLSELLSSAFHYYVAGYEDRSDQEYQRVTHLEHKIKLMLNPKEEDHQRLEEHIRNMIASIQQHTQFVDDFPDLHDEIVSLSRQVLKREWDRVKEPLTAVGTGSDA